MIESGGKAHPFYNLLLNCNNSEVDLQCGGVFFAFKERESERERPTCK